MYEASQIDAWTYSKYTCSSENNTIMRENNGDDIDFLVEFPDKDGNSFHAPSMADQNEMKMNESSFLHANPEVHKMVKMFNDGDLNHSVAICLTCHETRPQFHATKPSEKFHTGNIDLVNYANDRWLEYWSCKLCKRQVTSILIL